MNSGMGQRAAAQAAGRVWGLFLGRTRYRHAIEQELVALASLVLAVACSAKGILAKLPDGAERQCLLLACEQLVLAAGAIVDPRSDLQHWSESGVEDAIHAFLAHHQQSDHLRCAALEMARKREPSPRPERRASRNQGASGARPFPITTRRGRSTSWMLPMRTRGRIGSGRVAVGSLGSLWQYIARTLEGRIRTRGTGA